VYFNFFEAIKLIVVFTCTNHLVLSIKKNAVLFSKKKIHKNDLLVEGKQ